MRRVSVQMPSWPWWLLGGRKEKEPVLSEASLNPSTDALNFPTKTSPFKGKVKRRWLGKDGQRNHVDHDTVLLSDGVCSPGSEADGPEWSVGWTEPHGPEFQTDDEGDGGFLVLVPCYRGVVEGSSNQLLSAVKNLPNGFSSDDQNYMEQWLLSLQNL